MKFEEFFSTAENSLPFLILSREAYFYLPRVKDENQLISPWSNENEDDGDNVDNRVKKGRVQMSATVASL